MSKLYAKTWNERMSMATKAAHREVTTQLLYGSRSDSMIAAEVTVKYDPETTRFRLFIDVPGQPSTSYDLVDGRAQ